ncbi:MAG: hypothetical protein IH987_06965 [Planctomycetes bacterium]|nr:hypothetical protein [Planctomycetota bacterium]
MAEGQTISSVILAGVLGGMIGAVLTALYCTFRSRVLDVRDARRDAIARWLGARITLGRASVSFVAAFRSLAAERQESGYHGLRMEESQRVRAQWCRAAESLDLAEAALRVRLRSEEFAARLDGFERTSVESLRQAIDGDDVTVDRFVQAVLDAEREAIGLAGAMTAEGEPSRFGAAFRTIIGQVTAQVEGIADGWASKD